MKDEYVSLIPTRDANNAIEWTMIHNGSVGQGSDYPDIDLEKNQPDAKIVFTIIDPNKLGIKFDPSVVDASSNPKAVNAIWIADGSGSQKQAGPYPDQIDQVQLQKNNSKLVITDKNSEAAVLTYQLNFVKPGTTESITPIDPEIRNPGGGHGISLSMEVVVAVLSLAVLALVGLAWFTQARSSKAQASGARPEAQKPQSPQQ